MALVNSKYENNVILTENSFKHLLQNTSILNTEATVNNHITTGKYYHIDENMKKCPMAVVQTLGSNTTGTINYYDGTNNTTNSFIINGWPLDSGGNPISIENLDIYTKKTLDTRTGALRHLTTDNFIRGESITSASAPSIIFQAPKGVKVDGNGNIIGYYNHDDTPDHPEELATTYMGRISCDYKPIEGNIPGHMTLRLSTYRNVGDTACRSLTLTCYDNPIDSNPLNAGSFNSCKHQAVWSGRDSENADCYFMADKVFNAVFNDYAEYRTTVSARPGQCVVDNDDGTLSVSNRRLMPGAQVISDTFGHAMGETKDCKTPLAVAGRVLVYPFRDRSFYHAGMCVCTAPSGTVDIMTREEIKEYPDCIVGIVSEIPEYETWGSDNVKVDGRIWIKVK